MALREFGLDCRRRRKLSLQFMVDKYEGYAKSQWTTSVDGGKNMNIKLGRTIKTAIILGLMGGCAGYPGNYGNYYGGSRNYHGYGYPGSGQYGNYGYDNNQGYQRGYGGRDNDDWNRGGYGGGNYGWGGNGGYRQHRDND
jgi:hypothetical protein